MQNLITKTCPQCSIEFVSYACHNRKYCSRVCLGKSKSVTNVGSNNPNWRGGSGVCKKCGDALPKSNSPARGETQCLKCYRAYLRTRRGELAHSWKGGLSKTKAYKTHHSNISRAKRRRAPGSHTLAEWEKLKRQCNYTCVCCRKREPEITLTRDHIRPLSKGGSNNIGNIQPLCSACNNVKYTKDINYFLRGIGVWIPFAGGITSGNGLPVVVVPELCRASDLDTAIF